jgi:hypothetical protein
MTIFQVDLNLSQPEWEMGHYAIMMIVAGFQKALAITAAATATITMFRRSRSIFSSCNTQEVILLQ